MSDWSPSDYLKYEDERSRPARDLLAQVPLEAVRRVVDLGCGPGNSTEFLAARFPDAEIVGVDSSATMLEAARKRLPAATFRQADVATWSPEGAVDLVFANALFQWVPDHLSVMARIFEQLAPGAVMAVQNPDNFSEPAHYLMDEISADGRWSERFVEPTGRDPIPSMAVYYDRLVGLAARIDVWHTTYNHPLKDAGAIVEMMRSTGVRPYLARLDEAEQEEWLARFEDGLARAYPKRADARVLFRFPRLFVVAVRR